jgi:PAS domain S-box-containing protein
LAVLLFGVKLMQPADDYAVLFDRVADAMFVHRGDGHFIHVNQAACERLGYSKEELLRMGPGDIDDAENAHELAARIHALETRGRVVFESVHVAKDGRRIVVELHSRVVELSDGPAIVTVARDISERRQMQTTLAYQLQLQRMLVDISSGFVDGVVGDGLVTAMEYALTRIAEVLGPSCCRFAFVRVGGEVPEAVEAVRIWAQGEWYTEANRPAFDEHFALWFPLIGDAKVIMGQLVLEFAAERLPLPDEARMTLRVVAQMLGRILNKAVASERMRLLEVAVESASDGLVITNRDGCIIWLNDAFARMAGYAREELLGRNPSLLRSGYHAPAFYEEMWSCILSGNSWKGDVVNRCKDGSLSACETIITPVRDSGGEVTHFVAIKRRSTIQEHVLGIAEVMEQRLHVKDAMASAGSVRSVAQAVRGIDQSRKMDAIGQLAAGIAHEINTPVQYVASNMDFLGEVVEGLVRLTKAQQTALSEVALPAETREALERLSGELDLSYLLREYPLALEQSRSGIGRVADIVRAMRDFAHPGSGKRALLDLNKLVREAVELSRNEWKYTADIGLELAEDLPALSGYAPELSQAVLNLLVNAAHAVSEAVDRGLRARGIIKVRTRVIADGVELSVRDTGCGIPQHIRERIFEPFFTTKEVGKGTGQGLPITYDAVVNKHNGQLTFTSETGIGSEFIMKIPTDENAVPGGVN